MSYEKISLRNYIGKTLLKVCGENRDVVVLDGDLENSTTTNLWHEQNPDQFYQMGISEASAMSVAQGLALEGKIPFNVNFAIFVTGIAWNQLRQICYGNDNVKIIGTHPGLDNGPDGATHHANEDIALARTLPNLKVLIPSSLEELETSIKLAVEHTGPVYIRVARGDIPVTEVASFKDFGESVVTKSNGTDTLLIFEGSASSLAYEAYDKLTQEGHEITLLNVGSIKPLDKKNIVKNIKSHNKVITIENHSVIGGLGSTIADLIAEYGLSMKLSKIGINDEFTESGNSNAMKEKYGLNVEAIRALINIE